MAEHSGETVEEYIGLCVSRRMFQAVLPGGAAQDSQCRSQRPAEEDQLPRFPP